jgi:HPt (histidine-containing phosphotransfer) domain-containing protein
MDFTRLDNIQGLDYKKALAALNNMNVLYEKILKMFVNSFQVTAEKLNSAEDGEPFTIEIHSLKSSLRNIGLFELGDIAQEIEIHSKQNDAEYCRQNTPALLLDISEIVSKLRGII